MQPQQHHTLRPTGDRAAIQRDLERLDKWAKLHRVQQQVLYGTISEWTIWTGGQLDRKKLCRSPRGLGRHQAEHKPAV